MYTSALSTWMESANKSNNEVGGNDPENKVRLNKVNKFSEPFTSPK